MSVKRNVSGNQHCYLPFTRKLSLAINGLGCMCIISFLLQISCTQSNIEETCDIDKLINWYDQHKRTSPYLAKIHSKEKAMHDGKYVMFNESVGYLVFCGIKVELPLLNHFVMFDNFRKSNPKTEWLNYLDNLYSTTEYRNQSDIHPSVHVALVSFRTFELNGPLNKDNINNFTFSKSCDSLPGFKCLTFESTNLSGAIHYDFEDYGIKQINLDICPYYSEAFRDHLSARVNISYSSYDGISYLSSLHLEFENEKLIQWVNIDVLDQKTDIIDISNDEYMSLVGAYINPWISYSKEKWEKYNLPADDDISNIKNHLEFEDKLLEAQFFDNSGFPYYTREGLDYDSKTYSELLNRFRTEFYSIQ